MADTRVQITAGSGTPIDGFTQSDGDIRQAMVIGDAAGAQTALVDANGRLGAAIIGASLGSVGPTQIESTSANTPLSFNVAMAGNVTFWLSGSATSTPAAVTTGSVTFEQSVDGNNWAVLPVVRSDLGTATTTHSGTIASGGAIAFDAGVEGVNFVRVRPTANASSGTLFATIVAGGMPFSPSTTLTGTPNVAVASLAGTTAKGTQNSVALQVQDMRDTGRTPVWLQIDGVSTTTSEALAAYTGFKGTSAVTSSTANYTVTSGKTFRITSLQIAGGGAGATVRCRVRYANAAAPSVSSAVIAGISMAFASTGDGVSTPIPDGAEIPGGSQVAFTLIASAAMSTWVNLTGFEY